ncbi:MAG: nucleoside triphosphate pyrophosphohydrolase [Bdellovibrionales bacterium]|nr:nucleoside triphosphate pyrophosphohydrolase [Bdellovibrionales bacterium]
MANPEYQRFKEVIKQLRDPENGCPWDLKQTHSTLLKYLIEECYEFIHAVETENTAEMENELGDILLQILLHTTIAEESKNFNMESVCKLAADKMIRRHPHVFENRDNKIEVKEVLSNWEKIKDEEKGEKDSEIDDAYLRLPSLMSASKIGKKTQKIGFDWDDASQVSYKVEEEWQELKEEITPTTINKNRIFEEMGDFLFSIVQLARHLEIDPEAALRSANSKFVRRFRKMEELIKDDQKILREMNQKQMDVYWDHAKILEKNEN